ncbi:hypothetical protein TIFTF001_026963 [Ficus carica]|uniref:Uncharacterized protein n=1 Tax=Ficus carica TaxID=3494 RepID=A0AA88DM56_FICCA|nr:hypothetical protein TIFTF001_026963 [Ficus carica]
MLKINADEKKKMKMNSLTSDGGKYDDQLEMFSDFGRNGRENDREIFFGAGDLSVDAGDPAPAPAPATPHPSPPPLPGLRQPPSSLPPPAPNPPPGPPSCPAAPPPRSPLPRPPHPPASPSLFPSLSLLSLYPTPAPPPPPPPRREKRERKRGGVAGGGGMGGSRAAGVGGPRVGKRERGGGRGAGWGPAREVLGGCWRPRSGAAGAGSPMPTERSPAPEKTWGGKNHMR